MNNRNKLSFLAFLITASTMVSQSSAYTSAMVQSNVQVNITDDERALVALMVDSKPDDFNISVKNHLNTPIHDITIVNKETGDIVPDSEGLEELDPGTEFKFDIPESGNYIIEASWDNGSATLDRIFDVQPPILTMTDKESESNKGNKYKDSSIFEAVKEQAVELDKEVPEKEDEDVPLSNDGAEEKDTREYNISRTMVLNNIKVNIIHK